MSTKRLLYGCIGELRRTSLIRRGVQALTAYEVLPHTCQDAISRVPNYTDYTGNAYIEGITPNVVRDGVRGETGRRDEVERVWHRRTAAGSRLSAGRSRRRLHRIVPILSLTTSPHHLPSTSILSFCAQYEFSRHRNRTCSTPVVAWCRSAISRGVRIRHLAVLALAPSLQDQLQCPGYLEARGSARYGQGLCCTAEISVSMQSKVALGRCLPSWRNLQT